VKTTDERPHLRRGLPERGVSPSGWLRTGLARGYQVHTPLHRSQKRQRRPARLIQAPNGATKPRSKSQAAIPSQAGTSCQAGASTARSRDGQPSPKSNCGQRGQAQAESTPVSRRSQHPSQTHHRPSGTHPHGHKPSRRRRPSSRRESSVQPVSRFRGVKGRPSVSTATRTWPSHTPQLQPPGRHPSQACTLSVLQLGGV